MYRKAKVTFPSSTLLNKEAMWLSLSIYVARVLFAILSKRKIPKKELGIPFQSPNKQVEQKKKN